MLVATAAFQPSTSSPDEKFAEIETVALVNWVVEPSAIDKLAATGTAGGEAGGNASVQVIGVAEVPVTIGGDCDRPLNIDEVDRIRRIAEHQSIVRLERNGARGFATTLPL